MSVDRRGGKKRIEHEIGRGYRGFRSHKQKIVVARSATRGAFGLIERFDADVQPHGLEVAGDRVRKLLVKARLARKDLELDIARAVGKRMCAVEKLTRTRRIGRAVLPCLFARGLAPSGNDP